MLDMPQVETGYVAVNGGKLYYEVAGAGHPFLLIHAGVADLHMWDDQFPIFAQRYRVIRYDAREYGRTTTENITFSNRQDIVDLLNHLGVTQTYVMGCSRGGQIAIDFTLEHPEMVDALIVVAGGISGYEQIMTPEVMARVDPAEAALFAQMEAAFESKDYPTLIDAEMQMWIDGPNQPPTRVDPRMRAKVRAIIENNYAQHVNEAPEAQPLDPPAIDRLDEIHVPTLAIVGDLDASGAQVAMDYLAEHVGGAQKVVIPGTAHLPNMEQPAPFTQLVLNFLNNLPSS